MPPGTIRLYPLAALFSEIAALWVAVDVGYFLVLPKLGYALSYNTAPVANAAYFAVCAFLLILRFRPRLAEWFRSGEGALRPALYALQIGALGAALAALLVLFARIGVVGGFYDPPYTDILLATPWYFLPKAAEILVQQILITMFTVSLWYYFHDFKKVMLGYGVYFIGAHVLTMVVSHAPLPYVVILTTGAALSTFAFPYFILKVRGGWMHAYAFHVAFYIILALALHYWPPFGYAVL